MKALGIMCDWFSPPERIYFFPEHNPAGILPACCITET